LDENDSIIGAYIGVELVQYLEKPSKVKFSHFDVLESDMKELEFISPFDRVKGKNIYGYFGAVRTDLQKQRIYIYLIMDYVLHLHSQGIKYVFGRSSSDVTLSLAGSFSQVFAEKTVTIAGKQFPLSYSKIPTNVYPYVDIIRQGKLLIPKL
jgi:hypothetical protein